MAKKQIKPKQVQQKTAYNRSRTQGPPFSKRETGKRQRPTTLSDLSPVVTSYR